MMATKENLCLHELTDFLYLGSFAGSKEMSKNNITHVLNLAKEIDKGLYDMYDVDMNSFQYHGLELRDSADETIAPYFDECFRIIESARDSGGKILVHCIAGVSRSATVCIAYFMKHRDMTLKEAYFYVKGKRPVIRPNHGFWKQLIQYEYALNGRNTVELRSLSGTGLEFPDITLDEVHKFVVPDLLHAFLGDMFVIALLMIYQYLFISFK